MIRLAIAITIAAAAPAWAQTGVGFTHQESAGPAAGRSPHRAYRQIAGTEKACGAAAMHIPAGKLPHFGTHMTARSACPDLKLAARDNDQVLNRE